MIKRQPPNSQHQPSQSQPRHHSTQNLSHHVAQLEDQLEQLKAQVRQAQQLSSLGLAAMKIVHEVHNVLTPALGYALSARSADDVVLKDKALDVSVRQMNAAVDIARRVLEIGAAKETKLEPVPLRETVDLAVESLCRDLDKDGISFTADVDPDLIVLGDRLQLRQVLFNLFLNAREAMAKRHSGKLSVSARLGENEDEGKVIIEVKDSGPGIAADLLPRIFDPLQSSKPRNGESDQRCSGLGLALCRDFIEGCGGSIEVTSTSGKGTQFTITLQATKQLAGVS